MTHQDECSVIRDLVDLAMEHGPDARWLAPRLVRMPPITDYAIRYSSDNGSNWTLYPHVASAATSRRLILTNGNDYIFQVAPVVSGGVGVYSGTCQ